MKEFTPDQIILVNKPLNWTSFDVCNKMRSLIKKNTPFKNIKVGHGGTLDPLATGLIIICTGKKTKEIINFQEFDKEYIAEITIGGTTPSFDLETEVVSGFPTEHITEELLQKTIESFKGIQMQQPPIFSAKKINGEAAYHKARQGIAVEIKPVQINIKEIEILEWNKPVLKIRVLASKGTFIRTLADDIGRALNSGAYLSCLVRTIVGNYHLKNAIEVADFEKNLQSL